MKSTRKVLTEKELSKDKKEKQVFINMPFFKEASHRKLCGFGYTVRRFNIIWRNKDVPWNHLAIEYGIRWSDIWQIIPIWNTSSNGIRALMFGFWKIQFSIIYTRKNHFNQDRKLPFRNKFRRFYQLFF